MFPHGQSLGDRKSVDAVRHASGLHQVQNQNYSFAKCNSDNELITPAREVKSFKKR